MKTYLKISFVSLAFISCEDKEATARIEAAKAEAAKAETTKAEAAKAEALDNERQKTIEGVLSFLNGENLKLDLKWKDNRNFSMEWRKTYQYLDFSYDKEKRSLIFRQILSESSDSLQFPEVGSARSYAFDFSIDLSTSSPVVRIEDYVPFPRPEKDQQLPAKVVSFKANRADRSISREAKSENNARTPGLNPTRRRFLATITKEDLDNLKTLPWEERKEKFDTAFNVSIDTAPRLKAALEDLIRAHGISVSKY